MRKYFYLILLPLVFAACTQRTTTTTTTTDPNTGQQVTQTTTTGYDNGNAYSGYNQNYQVVTNNGLDYALFMYNGVQQYMLYSQFQQCMALGGYGYLSTYYGLHPSYFHNYGSYHWASSRRYTGGTYGGYYAANHIDASVYAPRNRVQMAGSNPQQGQRQIPQSQTGAAGMRNGAPTGNALPNANNSSMRNVTGTTPPPPQTNGNSGMRNATANAQPQRQAAPPPPRPAPTPSYKPSNSGMRSGSSGMRSGRR